MRIFSSRFSVSGTFHIATNSNAAVKMITPLEFFIRGRRDEDGTLLPVKELWVKAHFATLLEALGADRPALQGRLRSVRLPRYRRAGIQEEHGAARAVLESAAVEMPAAYVTWADQIVGGP